MKLFKKLRARFIKPKEQDLNDEMRFHLEKEIEANVAGGMNAEEARRRALIDFGGVQQAREAVHRVSARNVLESSLQDIRFGVRMLRKSPSFTAIAVGILALGIGANTAIFSAVNAVLFARWSIRNQQQLVAVSEPTGADKGVTLVSVPNFEDYRRQQTTFEQLSLWLGQSINLTGQERPDRLIGAFVSDNYFEMLGVKAGAGRTFLPGDDMPGANPVAVVTHKVWQTRFGGDSGLVGRQITLNNEPYTVVGILPQDLTLPFPSEVFVPAHYYTSYKVERQDKAFLLFGRIKDGTTRNQATTDLNTIAQRLVREYPKENAGIHVEIAGVQELLTQDVRTPLLALLGAVAMVLLIVCANIANLVLARGVARQREVAVRSALGAGRGRLVRQFLSESTLVAAAGGISGILLAHLLLKALQRVSPLDFPISDTAVLDLRVLAFTAGISVLTGVLFGVAPAVRFSRVNLSSALSGGSRTTGYAARDWVRSAFVVCQVAISLALLVTAGLLVRSFHGLLTMNPGFTSNHLLTMEYRLPRTKYQTGVAQSNFHRAIVSRVQQVPGVVSAAVVQSLPFSGNWDQVRLELPGRPISAGDDGFNALCDLASPEYFSTVGIPLIEGRVFSAHDDDKGAGVAIISQSFARKYFPDKDPLGSEVKIKDSHLLALAGNQATKRATIVGVVGSAKQRNVREELQPQIYFSYAQSPNIFGTLVVRTAVEPMGLSNAVRQAVWSVDKDQPVWKVRTVDFLIERDTAPDRFAMIMMSALSALALILSALGTYGMLSNAVQQRAREIGVRMALGATRSNVLKLVLLRGLTLIGAGVALGLLGAIASARLISTLLYNVSPGDITAFALAVAVMVLVGMLASYLPARRATRVDPLVALRDE